MDLTDDQQKRLDEYMTIKKHIKACFNMKKFIEIMKEGIDAAKDFDFSNPYNRKFIDPNRPIFILKTPMLVGIDMKKLDPKQQDALIAKVTAALTEQVVGNIEEKMMQCLCDKETYHELCEVDRDLLNLCITNVYKVKIDNLKGFVTLEYFDF